MFNLVLYLYEVMNYEYVYVCAHRKFLFKYLLKGF